MSPGAAAAIDLRRARADTPGCERRRISTTPGRPCCRTPVLHATREHLELEARIGGYEAAEQAAAEYEHTYDAVARMLGAHRDEVALVDSATRAWQAVFYAIDFKPGDRILVGMAEYTSNYVPMLQVSHRTGAVIEVIPDDEHGQISIDALARALQRPAKLISLVHVPSQSGLVNPAEVVGRLAREAGVTYILDACQSAGNCRWTWRPSAVMPCQPPGESTCGRRGHGLSVRARFAAASPGAGGARLPFRDLDRSRPIRGSP